MGLSQRWVQNLILDSPYSGAKWLCSVDLTHQFQQHNTATIKNQRQIRISPSARLHLSDHGSIRWSLQEETGGGSVGSRFKHGEDSTFQPDLQVPNCYSPQLLYF